MSEIENNHALLKFAGELQESLRKAGVRPVGYGSLAYVAHTGDQTEIHDIDFLVPESAFDRIITLTNMIPETTHERTDYHSLKIFRDGLKVAFDAREHYLKGIDPVISSIKIAGIFFDIIDRASLIEVYRRGAASIPTKRAAYLNKLQGLSS